MKVNKGWLGKLLLPESKRAERRPAEQFAAYRWAGTCMKMESVRDISATGFYLLTEERWPTGKLVSFTLQREGPLEKSPERRITTQARAARWGEDGVGLSFVSPQEPEAHLWQSLLESLVEQTRPEEMLDLIRMAEALAFLIRLCPDGAEEVGELVRGRLSNHGVECAVEIALKAENLLKSEPDGDRMRGRPHLVARILEDGSRTDEDWLQQFWAGLLATACTLDGGDESNLEFIDLFSQLATIHARILTTVCIKATTVISESGSVAANPLAWTAEEIMEIPGSRELQIEHDLARLDELGLIEKRLKSPAFLQSDEIYITPSSIGLQLYALCKGHRGAPQDFYAVKSAYAPLSTSEPLSANEALGANEPLSASEH